MFNVEQIHIKIETETDSEKQNTNVEYLVYLYINLVYYCYLTLKTYETNIKNKRGRKHGLPSSRHSLRSAQMYTT